MSFQTPPNRRGYKTSAAAVFPNTAAQELFRTLQKDLTDLRNTVDALVTLYNAHTHKCAAADAIASAPDTTASLKTPTAASTAVAPSDVVITE